jgi:hypothetical protein
MRWRGTDGRQASNAKDGGRTRREAEDAFAASKKARNGLHWTGEKNLAGASRVLVLAILRLAWLQ